MSPIKFKIFLLLKLPIAFLAGVRLKELSSVKSVISIKLGFLNQNPFKSMFWAVQGMGAELSTGTLCLQKIQNSKQKISMLVINQKAEFTKKAVGEIYFTCFQGEEIDKVIEEVILSKESRKIELKSIGIDEQGDKVSEFNFEWSFKLR